MSDCADAARLVLQSHWGGVLSTHSARFIGYPFGSIVPFCLDETGQPLILISRLAQHTQNIKLTPKVALTVSEQNSGSDPQQQERLTLLADAQPAMDVEAAAARYYRYFPQAQGYHDQLDFEFFQLQVVQVRFIAGFGRIHWVAADSLIKANPFSGEQEAAIVSHMNEDHQSALLHYCVANAIDHTGSEVELCAVDAEGLVLRVGNVCHRIGFPRVVTTAKEAREMLVEMAK